MKRKTISMPDQMGDWISGRINQGQYNNESEYFRDLVRQDQEEQHHKQYLFKRLDAGDQQLAEGAYVELSSDQAVDNIFAAFEDE